MLLAEFDLFSAPEAASRPPVAPATRPPAVVDLSRIDTTPGAEGPFAPPIGMDDGKAYARHLRQTCDGLLRQDFGIVAGWVCAPRPHTPRVVVTGPFAAVFNTCLKRFHRELQR